ncbi:MAG: CRISPR-associated helicase Cas3' [Anaerolineae bacterium]
MYQPPAWPEDLERIWAKSPREGESAGESLAAHTWALLCRLGELAALRPSVPILCALPNFWTLMGWAAFLHDWGKVARGFQKALRDGLPWGHRHEVLSLAFLDWIAPALGEEEATWVAAAIATHHKDAVELDILYPDGLPPEDDPLTDLAQELEWSVVQALWQWLWDVGPRWFAASPLAPLGLRSAERAEGLDLAARQVLAEGRDRMQEWLRRVRGLVERLHSEDDALPLLRGILTRGTLLQADHIASALGGAVHASPLPRIRWTADSVLRRAGLTTDSLYEHQKWALGTRGSALLVAPTGSGKTEAALLWATRQGRPRLFYALPYQASMNAMYDRLRAIFGEATGLLHGRGALALYQRLMDQDYTPKEATRLARWAHNLASLPFHPVKVFSPYQMLKAAYQLKGYEAILADYTQAAFVFDEIHAYEPRRLALILETVRYLRERLDAQFLVMSATMPRTVRQRLAEALPGVQSIRASDPLYRSFARHQLHILEGHLLAEEVLDRILEAFQEQALVLVACNTVGRAQEVYRALRERVPSERRQNLFLLHGRFHGVDRQDKERRIQRAAQLGSVDRQPILLVATQVVEVSLNLDLDVLFSEPAPLEALIQRFGRVNRKQRMESAPVYVCTEPDDGQGVYDSALVQASLALLAREADGRIVDEARVQDWLDEAYTGPILKQWEREFDRTAEEFRAAFLETLRPFTSDPTLEEAFHRLFDGLEVLPLSLEEEYRRLQQCRPLEADQLLVPISWGRWHQLRQEGRIWTEQGKWPQIVDALYSQEFGLVFTEEDVLP